MLRKVKQYFEAAGQNDKLRQRLAAAEAELSETRAELAERRTLGRDIPVFFVVGEPKSGTGWLTKMLDSHPEILCRGGGRFFDRELKNEALEEIQAGEADGARMQPSSLYRAMLEAQYLRLWIEKSVWSRNEDPEEHLTRLTRRAIDYFLMENLSKTNKRVVGDKTPRLTPNILREISVIYPEAKVIHIIRDGRDQVVSRMHHAWKRGRDRGGSVMLVPEELDKRQAFFRDPQAFLASGEGIFLERRLRSYASEWATRVGRAIEDGPALIGGDYAEVRYEDLLERPVQEAANLFEFLGTDAAENTVSRCVEATSFESLSGRERGQENYDLDHGKYRKGVAGDWKNVLTERDKEIFKEEAGNLLVGLGYEKDNDW